MDSDDARRARAWLAARGVVRGGDGAWLRPQEYDVDEVLTANDVAHEWTERALADPDLTAVGRLRLALGLLDLLDEYWVAAELRSAVIASADPAVAEAHWVAVRRRLEAPEPAEAITYALWVDWFEDRATTAVAFAEVLGDTVAGLRARGRVAELAEGPLFRRAERVLAVSGPVLWPLKHEAYQVAASLPALHPALLRGLVGSRFDGYGAVDPVAALDLLSRLDLPAGTENLALLRAALVEHRRR